MTSDRRCVEELYDIDVEANQQLLYEADDLSLIHTHVEKALIARNALDMEGRKRLAQLKHVRSVKDRVLYARRKEEAHKIIDSDSALH